MTAFTYNNSEISSVARNLLDKFGSYSIWLFRGEMGTGKTTLIKEVCSLLGVVDEMSSPTFSIVNVYEAPREEIYHFDFYRIEDSNELKNIGIEEYFDSGNRCFIEWPDKAIKFLRENYLEINIKLVESNSRNLTVSFNGPTV